MDEISLADVIADAVSDYLAGRDRPAMLNGFVFACSTVDTDGGANLQFSYPETQPYHQSLGLVGFAEEYVRDDIREVFAEMRREE